MCRAAAVVLLIGLWFDGGLFNLATAAPLWVLLELGSGTVLPACRGKGEKEVVAAEVTRRTSLTAMPTNPPPYVGGYYGGGWLATLLIVLLLTGLLWAKSRDPFHREWLSLRTSAGEKFSSVAVMPDRGGPFPVVVWCHGSGGSVESSGETLQQFATLGMAAVGIEYDKSNQTNFDAQFVALLDGLARKPWAARKPLTPSLSPSDGERVAEGRVRGSGDVRPTLIAWAGNSLGAQRELSFLARHPERQPQGLVRLNGGMVEEFREKAESGKRESGNGSGTSTPHPQSPVEAEREGKAESGNGDSTTKHTEHTKGNTKENLKPDTFKLETSALPVWIAHGEKDEVFPVSEARKVAEALRAAGADVRLDVFPGRGHGFGEDQPLLVKMAAEFCARVMEAKTPVPVNVRPSLWYYWLPVGLIGGVFVCQMRRRTGTPHPDCDHPLPIGWGEGRGEGLVGSWQRRDRWLKVCASVALIAATLVSAAHLALPLFRATPANLKLARHWCVRPELRADFDWLAQQPGVNKCRIRDLLEHLNLASVQRGQFAASLPENEWREFVLSPWIEGASEDIAWRRELWEWMAPRVRRETDAEQALRVVVRELHRRVVVVPANVGASIRETWNSGVVYSVQQEQLLTAMLRSIGMPARIGPRGVCEYWANGHWGRAGQTFLP